MACGIAVVGSASQDGVVAITVDSVAAPNATVDPSGATAGGRVRIGGEFKGGKDSAIEEVRNATRVTVAKTVLVLAAA